jgi:hypothetical protein
MHLPFNNHNELFSLKKIEITRNMFLGELLLKELVSISFAKVPLVKYLVIDLNSST